MPDKYDVGYKKTPKHTRFKKGHSGNPKGRPKKAVLTSKREHINQQFNHMMIREYVFAENGKEKSLPFIMWMIKRIQADALKGNRHSQKMLLDWLRENLDEAYDNKMEVIQGLINNQMIDYNQVIEYFDKL